MMATHLGGASSVGEVLLIGAHADDIEIGCGATVRRLTWTHPHATFRWVVLSATGVRQREAERSAAYFLADAAKADVRVASFRDGYFPWLGGELKDWFEALKLEVEPDLVFTHARQDRHQDHRLVSDLTWNTFRDHLVLEYEVPKFDGDLGHPNTFVPIAPEELGDKIAALHRYFPSQQGRTWFHERTFAGLAALRGIEGAAPSGLAEAFHVRKQQLGLTNRPPGRLGGGG
jgi:LmbE family N-acetylglucosaminyl deacetylase